MRSFKKWKVGWGITSKCNMHCPFCYSLDARVNSEDIDLVILKKFVRNNYSSIESINYGTGENTLSNDWFDLLKYVKNNFPNIKQALTTNGYLSHIALERSDVAEVLKALSEVDVSLDFCEPQKHNEFRGNKYAAQWAEDTLKLCMKNNIKATIVIMAIDGTMRLGNLKGIFDIAHRYNCFVRINIFRPNNEQKLKPLSYSSLKSALHWIILNHSVVSLSDPLFSALFKQKSVEDASGKTSLRILPGGEITPSTYLVKKEFVGSRIQSANLNDEAFSKKLLATLGDTSVLPTGCTVCELRDSCKGGAIDRRQIWYGSLDRRDPYCPLENKDSINTWYGEVSQVADGPQIHDGYLPTLIFKPGRV